MKISGFTILRNGVVFDYPFVESIRSLLPMVDELIINVGVGTDSTLEAITKLAQEPDSRGKIVLFESRWPLDDPEARRGGKILSDQTNLALDRCTGDWCLYLQADEVLHQDDLPAVRRSLEVAHSISEVDALVFNYVHFYGSFDIEQYSRGSYRREVRCIRGGRGIRSVGDAQGFRHADGTKVLAVRTPARVFHYGWVRTPEAMKSKTEFMDTLYHGDTGVTTGNNYRYKRIPGLRRFKGTHPAVMLHRIQQKNWNWEIEKSPLEVSKRTLKNLVLNQVERLTGIRLFEYQNYRLRSERPV